VYVVNVPITSYFREIKCGSNLTNAFSYPPKFLYQLLQIFHIFVVKIIWEHRYVNFLGVFKRSYSACTNILGYNKKVSDIS